MPPKKTYPLGLSYLLLDKNNKYNHRKILPTMNNNTSDTNPKEKILMISITTKLDWVIGWKRSTILRMKLTTRNNTRRFIKGDVFLK